VTPSPDDSEEYEDEEAMPSDASESPG